MGEKKSLAVWVVTMAVSLSLCMIVRDEDETLSRALLSVGPICDEIVIVDTGSGDNTVAIAKRFTNKVYRLDWCDDFSMARNSAFSCATKDYMFWMDADETLSPSGISLIRKMKKHGFFGKSVIVCRSEAVQDHGTVKACWRQQERFFSRRSNPLWRGFVRETIPWGHDFGTCDAAFLHEPSGTYHDFRNLQLCERHMDAVRSDAWAEMFYAKELYRVGKVAAAELEFLKVLSRDDVLDLDRIDAYRNLARISKSRGNIDEELDCLLRALSCGVPTAELSCEIGENLARCKRYREAAFWFNQALAAPKNSGGETVDEAHDLLPVLMLKDCYQNMGFGAKSTQYQQLAKKLTLN